MIRFDLGLPTDIRFGAGRLSEVAAALDGLGASRVFVVTGRSGARAEPIREALAAAGIESTSYAVVGEPTVDLLRDAVAGCARAGCDAVLGLGGGSALDVAKAVAILARSGSDPLDHVEVVGAGRPISVRGLPCVAVPTTAGTGSEVTRNAVLSHAGVKASLRSPLMLPKVAIVDPDLLAGVPAPTVAASGMDALSQLIEPLISARSNPFTDALARDGIRRSARSLRAAYERGLDDPERREDLALASLFGGLCLANAGLGAVHGIAGPAGGRLGAPHGALCAAVLAACLETNLQALRERAPDHPALPRFDELGPLLTGRPEATAGDATAWLRELTAALNIPGLSTYGLTDADLPDLAAAALNASSMRANPIPLTSAEVEDILRRSLQPGSA